jgi:D-alanyl-D-alanine endopeptidase (penicillin-binding protein 7)
MNRPILRARWLAAGAMVLGLVALGVRPYLAATDGEGHGAPPAFGGTAPTDPERTPVRPPVRTGERGILQSPAASHAGPAAAPDAGAPPNPATPVWTPKGPAPAIRSDAALVVDEGGIPVFAKHTRSVKPIASITKLMTAMVVLDSGVDLGQTIEITDADRDRLRHSRSRMRTNAARLSRRDMLTIALMSSENRAASALGRTTLPGGTPEFVAAMNRKAQTLGMADTRYADASGLDGANRSTAEDLVRLLQAANRYPLIREATTRSDLEVQPYAGGGPVPYRNTNPLVRSEGWRVELSKTGYVNEAGHCLAMQAQIAGRRYWIVLLDSAGKLTPVGDSNRLRKWIEASLPGRSAQRG